MLLIAVSKLKRTTKTRRAQRSKEVIEPRRHGERGEKIRESNRSEAKLIFICKSC